MVTCLSPNGTTTFVGPSLPDRLLVATLGGVVTAERRGNRFEVVAWALADRHISSLCFEPVRGAVFAGSYAGGVHVSFDRGETWQETGPELGDRNVYTVATCALGGEVTVYVGTEPVALYKSTDYGATWVELPAIGQMPGKEKWTFPGPPHEAHLKNMIFDATDPLVMFASIEQGGLFTSTDGGTSWRELDGIEQVDDDWFRDVHRVIVRPGDAKTMFISGGDGMSRSDDGGKTWRRVLSTTFSIGYPDGLVIDPREPDLMFLSGARHQPGTWRESHCADAHVARSSDGGVTWELVGTDLPDPLRGNIEALSLSAAPDGLEIYAGTTDGEVYVSADNGEHFALGLDGLGPVSKGGHYRALVTTA